MELEDRVNKVENTVINHDRMLIVLGGVDAEGGKVAETMRDITEVKKVIAEHRKFNRTMLLTILIAAGGALANVALSLAR